MKKSIILGALVGAAIAFVWGFISWMALPWYDSCFKSFRKPHSVRECICENICESGMYMLPNCSHEGQSDRSTFAEEYEKGPVMFASIARHGKPYSMTKNLIVQAIMLLITAGIISYIVTRLRPGASYGHRLKIVTLAGLFVAILTAVPNWNWWCFPSCFTIVNFFDVLLTWFFAGLGIAAFAHPPVKR